MEFTGLELTFSFCKISLFKIQDFRGKGDPVESRMKNNCFVVYGFNIEVTTENK